MTLNDMELTECSRAIHNADGELDRLTRENQREELRKRFKLIFEASWHALNRLDEYERA